MSINQSIKLAEKNQLQMRVLSASLNPSLGLSLLFVRREGVESLAGDSVLYRW
jgi:hypothetical protein